MGDTKPRGVNRRGVELKGGQSLDPTECEGTRSRYQCTATTNSGQLYVQDALFMGRWVEECIDAAKGGTISGRERSATEATLQAAMPANGDKGPWVGGNRRSVGWRGDNALGCHHARPTGGGGKNSQSQAQNPRVGEGRSWPTGAEAMPDGKANKERATTAARERGPQGEVGGGCA